MHALRTRRPSKKDKKKKKKNKKKYYHKYVMRKVVTDIGDSDSNAENNKTENHQLTQVQSNRFLVRLIRRILKMSEDKMIMHEMITTCPEQYMNVHMKVTRTVVYNETLFLIMPSSAHSGSNTKTENGNDTSFLGEGWTFLKYTTRNTNMCGYSDGIYMK